jgi:hypothetical protein
MSQQQRRDEALPDFVVIHFFRMPSGELRCRVTDAQSRESWIARDAASLRLRICERIEATQGAPKSKAPNSQELK